MSTTILNTRAPTGSGLSNQMLGTLCFLAAEVMFFLGLAFVALEVRRSSIAWPPPGTPLLDLRLPLANTVVLLVSSLTMHMAVRRIKRADRKGLTRWLAVTTALGVLFIVGQAVEFQRLGGWLPSEDAYRALFDTLVALHAVHVLAGIALLAFVLARSSAGRFSTSQHTAVTGAELYWHFVTAAWLLMLGALVNVQALPDLVRSAGILAQ